MSYLKDSLFNTSLPALVVERKERFNRYPQIGFGDEGAVYKYNDEIAFKTFEFTKEQEILSRKFAKIEEFGRLRDESACFPIGLMGYEDHKKEGYYTSLVHPDEHYNDFDLLIYMKDMRRKLQYVLEVNEAIKRFHQMGLIIGDIKGDNIMIDSEGHIKFVDTDNWKYGDFDFDLTPGRSTWLSRTYEEEFSELDNEKFVFGMMAIQIFLSGTVVSMHPNDYYFQRMIEYLRVPKDTKEGLRDIFSSSHDKPYIGDVLKDISTERELITEQQVLSLNRYYY